MPDGHNREDDGVDAKARRAVRTNNFTQQTNTVDVDKRMYAPWCLSSLELTPTNSRMAYIEENLYIRSQPLDPSKSSKDKSAEDEFTLSERWKTEKKAEVEGSVTSSLPTGVYIVGSFRQLDYRNSLSFIHSQPSLGLPPHLVFEIWNTKH